MTERIQLVRGKDGSWCRPDCQSDPPCRFHIFDGAPKLEQSSIISTGETILIGRLAPHWHICERHAAIKIEMDRGE